MIKRLVVLAAALSFMGATGCGNDEAFKKLEAFKTKACACEDVACGKKVMDDFNKEMANTPIVGEEAGAKATKLQEEVTACIKATANK